MSGTDRKWHPYRCLDRQIDEEMGNIVAGLILVILLLSAYWHYKGPGAKSPEAVINHKMIAWALLIVLFLSDSGVRSSTVSVFFPLIILIAWSMESSYRELRASRFPQHAAG